MTKNYKVLVITPVKHIKNVKKALHSFADITFIDDPSIQEFSKIIHDYDAIFTNPNKSKIYLGEKNLQNAKRLKVICTASTGVDHIDLDYVKKNNIQVLSISKDYDVLNKISSTAEHAFLLTLAGIRKFPSALKSVLKDDWNYTNYIGRQMNFMTVGIIGYGRLGHMYANYCLAFGSKVLAYDPFKNINDTNVQQVDSLENIYKYSDIISLHIHMNKDTNEILNSSSFNQMKEKVAIINTSRGGLVNEKDLIKFLSHNSDAIYATDVVSDEVKWNKKSPIIEFAKSSDQIIITPHIGGMTTDAQEIAYNLSVQKLKIFFTNLK